MLVFYAANRGIVNLMIVVVMACFLPIVVISTVRKQRARLSALPAGQPISQHPLTTLINEAGAIGVGIVWTILILRGPSLTQLWLGAHGVSHWTTVLFYTMVWLSMSRVIVPATGRLGITTAIITRALLGISFFTAIAGLNDW